MGAPIRFVHCTKSQFNEYVKKETTQMEVFFCADDNTLYFVNDDNELISIRRQEDLSLDDLINLNKNVII